MNHGHRFEDVGLARLIKDYGPLICLVFTLGGWYQESRANIKLSEKIQAKIENHETRMTQVEDAVKYLAQIVKEDRRNRQ